MVATLSKPKKEFKPDYSHDRLLAKMPPHIREVVFEPKTKGSKKKDEQVADGGLAMDTAMLRDSLLRIREVDGVATVFFRNRKWNCHELGEERGLTYFAAEQIAEGEVLYFYCDRLNGVVRTLALKDVPANLTSDFEMWVLAHR